MMARVRATPPPIIPPKAWGESAVVEAAEEEEAERGSREGDGEVDDVGEGEGEGVWEGVKEGVGVGLEGTAAVTSDTPLPTHFIMESSARLAALEDIRALKRFPPLNT